MSKLTAPLIVALVLALMAVANAEQTTTTTTVTGSSQTTVDDDGWVRAADRLYTGQATGRSATVHSETQVTKTDTGRSWIRQTTGSNSAGGSFGTTTTGEAVNHGDGTGTWTSTTDGTRTGANGTQRSWVTERSGQWTKVDDGVAEWTAAIDRTWDNGTTAHIDRSGTTSRTEDGRTWSATGSGSNSLGQSWTGVTSGSVRRNGDGTASVNVTHTITRDNGVVIDVTRQGTVTRSGDGKATFDGTVTYTRTTPDGATESTQRQRTGEATHRSSGGSERKASPKRSGRQHPSRSGRSR